MAQIVFTAAANAVSSSVGASATTAAAIQLGASIVGKAADAALFSAISNRGRGGASGRGPRLDNLEVQSSVYGRMIPILYGTVRMAGNIIWSQAIQEIAVPQGGGGKGGLTARQTDGNVSYRYTVSLAIAICEGRIDEILRVWADAKTVDPTQGTYRIHRGGEAQLPDPLIESIEGVGQTPAFRGLAYVVIEDFPLGDFGNRIPNFTFEVRRTVNQVREDETPLEERITDIVMIPGSGEFVYDTQIQNKIIVEDLGGGEFVQTGQQFRINQNNRSAKADTLVALDQLQANLPNAQWIAVVVTWFGNSIDAGDCIIKPGVEYTSGAITAPELWEVGSFTRVNAHTISLDDDGNPVYGGTPSDESLLRYLDELRTRGYNIMFYPMFFMDTTNKPWRGRVTGTSSEVSNFFTKTNGYNAFITHYANLVEGKVDAFVIGSELIGLTSVQAVDDSFPAVDQLVSLAASVKSTLGGSVKVTYAADWSEYHHTTGGWYNLDPLWASPNIDVIGIDAYFPLTDEPQSGITEQKIMDGWTSGEGYNWYYSDEERTVQTPLAPAYAWKNISYWWSHTHTNPDSSTTDWEPESKKIWFTEFGFPSVDGASNQPNVFYDPNSSESSFPRHSQGRVDFFAQRQALNATLKKWENSDMVERMFIWTWDARPYPFWPALTSVWGDTALWATGHWIQGKIGLSNLGAIVADLMRRSGLSEDDFNTHALYNLVEGFVLAGQITARDAIEALQQAYFFDAVESAGKITCLPRAGEAIIEIPESDLLPDTREGANKGEVLGIAREQELMLPNHINVNYINRLKDYQPGNQHSARLTAASLGTESLLLPIVMSDQEAKNIADRTLYNTWLERTRYQFELPLSYAHLEPSDVVTLTTIEGASHTIRITGIYMTASNRLRIRGVAHAASNYDFYNPAGEGISNGTEILLSPGETLLHFLDLPSLPNDDVDGTLRVGASGLEAGWKGAVLYRSNDGGEGYDIVASLPNAATAGASLTVLADGPLTVFDHLNSVTVSLITGELTSASELGVLNGANVALLGDEIIQFTTANLLAPGKYELSGLLRGRCDTESATTTHISGERFIMLNNHLLKMQLPEAVIGLPRDYKPVSVGNTLGSTEAESFTWAANCLKPYAPVHIRGTRDGSDNLTFHWIRRTRVGGEWRDGVDVPLIENSEAYEVDILDGDTVVRTIEGLTSPTATYSALEQTADFGAPQSVLSIRVYQLSEKVGRGTAGEGEV
ncbi:MAG: hypothetical protein K0R63_939 [Rickettsiales bacterium]|jgi:hypothetical protein|nr:hypothetical protein [Rickettsiales bacterium]